MGNKIDILIKCFTLLFREQELIEKDELSKNELSADLVKSILQVLSTDKKPLTGGETMIVEDLKNLLIDLTSKTDEFNKVNTLQTLEVILREKEQLFSIVEKSLTTEMSVSGSKNSIASLRKHLYRYYKESEMINLISKASYVLNTSKTEEGVSAYISNLVDKLQALNVATTTKDPAIQEMVDIDDVESLEKEMDEMSKNEVGGDKLITGWKKLNKMLGGGFRLGEQWVLGALQHNYKSGFVRSLFVQLVMHNKPLLLDPKKKPLALFISFEDQAIVINSFIYKYLYFNEFNEVPDFSTTTAKEISQYVSKNLSRNGYKVMIMKVDPNLWTYQNIMNKITELEANGYECKILVLDYLTKMNTAGCRQGPMGTEYRDMFDKVRQYTINKGILSLIPHQLSTEAMGLIKSGIDGFDFLSEIANKGYYADSRQIQQVVDGELYLRKAKYEKQWALYVGRGKHRSTKIVANDNDLQMVLPFPKNGMPIKEDLHEPDIETNTGKDEDFFL